MTEHARRRRQQRERARQEAGRFFCGMGYHHAPLDQLVKRAGRVDACTACDARRLPPTPPASVDPTAPLTRVAKVKFMPIPVPKPRRNRR
jgi:hypothetical protein